MAEKPLRIALHCLLLESPAIDRRQLEDALQASYPDSSVTPRDSPRAAQEALRVSVYDLVLLCLAPLSDEHGALLEALLAHPTPMPAILIIAPGTEEALFELMPRLPGEWEVLDSSQLTVTGLHRRIQKAIETHQQQWALRHLQSAFQSSLARYRNLFDEVPDLIFICDRSGCLLDVNSTAHRLFGRGKEEILMRPIFEVFGMAREDFDRLLERALAQDGPIQDIEIKYHHPSGQIIYGLTHLIRWQSDGGRPLQFQGVIKDISPHKRLEQQLRQSEDKYKTLYDLARITVSSLKLEVGVDRSLNLIHWCCQAKGALLLLNRQEDELVLVGATAGHEILAREGVDEALPRVGQGVLGRLAIGRGLHVLERDELAELPPRLRDWLAAIEPEQVVAITLGHNNPTLPASLLLMALSEDWIDDESRELLAGLATTLEMGMTNCFHYANSLETEQRYRDLWENAPAFFISILRGGIIFEINRTAAALGYEQTALVGQPMRRLVHPDDHELFDRMHRLLLETGQPQGYELRLVRAGGQPMVVSVNSEPLLDHRGGTIGEKSVLADITRDREMSERLRDYAENLERMVQERTVELTQTTNFLNGILEGSTEYAIVGLDGDGTFLTFNHGAQLLFGYDAAEMVGAQKLELLINLEHSPWASSAELFRAVDRENVLVHETPMRTAHGRHVIGLLTINRLKAPAANNLTYVAIIRDITEQKELEDLLKLYTENLQQLIEEKTRELDQKHIQLIQSSKLATLGEMATGIAHELNQPLSGIRTRAQFILKAIERDQATIERIIAAQQEIVQLVDRMSLIIHHMRIFARQDQQNFVPFRLVQSVDGALSLLGEQLRIHAIHVERQIEDNLPMVYGEPLQIEQVILNLLSNARDSMDERAEALRGQQNGERPYQKRLKLTLRRVGDKELCLEVRDNGVGMNDETQRKIFEPFFTTKPVGRGTGLGLSISYGILTNHKGRMDFKSREGEGTTFRVYLPIWDGRSARRAVEESVEGELII